MCSCENVEIGSFNNQVKMKNWWNGGNIYVDTCLWKEIHFLWDNKVRTTGCCCGHNKVKPMINVVKDHHYKMIDLGYKYWINKHGTYCYEPLSI